MTPDVIPRLRVGKMKEADLTRELGDARAQGHVAFHAESHDEDIRFDRDVGVHGRSGSTDQWGIADNRFQALPERIKRRGGGRSRHWGRCSMFEFDGSE